MGRVPDPPDQFDLELEEWPAGTPIVRVFPAAYPPTAFNATAGSARFRPVYDIGGQVVPTLYGAATRDAAFAESLLHDLSQRRRRTIPYERVRSRVLADLHPRRPLRLAALHGVGLQRAGVKRSQLIDTLPPSYPQTAKWGQAVHDGRERAEGIVWMSRQFDSQKALMLFGDRVAEDDLELDAGTLLPLDAGAGFELAAAAALRAGFARISRP